VPYRQVPANYRLAERMSNKALYYSDDIHPGTVLLLDDIALSEELQEVLKESTTKFTERARMRVVNKDRRVQHFTIPVLNCRTSDDDGGRAATNRQLFFLFDPEVYREARVRARLARCRARG
jgi:hypothetical protein